MPKIDVRIPFEPNGKLGQDYNRIMTESRHKWVLLIDHDIFFCNPHWYLMCQKAIEICGETAGVITCWNNETGPQQISKTAPDSSNLLEHRKHALHLLTMNQHKVTEVEKASGFFLLVNKQAWRDAGKFPGKGVFHEDWQFCKKVKHAGYKIFRMDGMYVYHLKDRKIGSWIQGEKTTKEIWDDNHRTA